MDTLYCEELDYEQVSMAEDIPREVLECAEFGEAVPDRVLQVTKQAYGISYLYPWQRMVIENILEAAIDNERGNQIVLLPTGAGKSLCFMVPAILLDGPTLILYPLLALMADQERRMKEGGMDVVVFRGQQSAEERTENFKRIKDGAKFILANPEVLQSSQLVAQLSNCAISHIAIDEAHCVSEWGDTFRPAYISLGEIIKNLKVSVVTAFTATASPEVLSRLAEVLFNGDAHIIRSEADRQNIRYYVNWNCAKKKALIEVIMTEKRPLIVFCSSRKRTKELSLLLQDFLQRYGETNSVKFYHAGLSREEKTEIEQWFYPKTDGILVSTCAFGMGVDKKDIKTVIHFDPPSTAEAYLQEAGRGGRDGSVAKAILLWSPQDSKKAANLIPHSRSRVLADFAESSTCRRQILLDALGAEQTACSGCDICEKTACNEAGDAKRVLAFLHKNRRRYEKDEALSLVQSKENFIAVQKWAMCLWEEEDVQEIFKVLISEGKLKMKKDFKQAKLRHSLHHYLHHLRQKKQALLALHASF